MIFRHCLATIVLVGVLAFGTKAFADNGTTAGTITVSPGNRALVVTADYGGDDNQNNTVNIEWGLNGVDFSLGSTSLSHNSSPYRHVIEDLDVCKSYQVRVTFLDAEGATVPVVLTDLTPNNPILHNSISTGSDKWAPSGWGVDGGKYGEFSCNTCHTRKAPNIKRIRGDLTAPDGTVPFPVEAASDTIAFTDTRDGSADFGDDTEGHVASQKICEGCHSTTAYHRYNTAGQASLEHYNRTDCVRCHRHNSGFGHGGGSGTGCDECHGKDDDQGGAGTTLSHSTHTENDTDDQRGPRLACDACHDTAAFPYFRSGNDSNGDGRYTLTETDVCDACHSPGGAYDGVNDPAIGAKPNWAAGVYAGEALGLGKEKWCAGCHDDGSSIIASVAAPNVIGDEDGDFIYGKGWGFYKTGHGVSTSATMPASGGATTGPNQECADCHDPGTSHIDGNPRTFECGSGTGGACSTQYQTGYRLKDVDGNEPMVMPPNGVNIGSYRLCFSCHTNTDAWLTNNRAGTNFYQEGISRNDHYYHLTAPAKSAEHDWDGAFEGWLSCIVCHNVHGSKNPAMIRSGELTGFPSMTVRYGNSCSTHTAGQTEPVPNNVTLALSTKATMLGNLTGTYCQHCHGSGTGIVSVVRNPVGVPNLAPELDWVGGPAYASDGVNPDVAMSGTTFTFKVEYADINQDGPPDTIQVWIDRNDDGSYQDHADPALDETIDMTSAFVELDGCAPYSTGVDYIAAVTIDKFLAAGNSIKYKFFAEYGGIEATGPPTSERTLTILNAPPVLSWTGENNFADDGVNPDYGPAGGIYEFRTRYIDDDGDTCPASDSADIQVWIDLDGSSTYDFGEKFNLKEVSAGDSDCTSSGGGKLYYTDRALPNTSGGRRDYNYRYHASDGTHDATGIPTADHEVTVVATVNNPPYLAWNSGSCRPQGAMPPRTATGSTVNFSVSYVDEDNQCPASGSPAIQVWVDLNNDGDYADAGEKVNLDEESLSDTDCTSAGGGKAYGVTVAPTTVGDGISYEFHASDGTDEALGAPRTVGDTVDVISATKVVRQDGSEDYTTISAAISGTVSGATILVYDGTYSEKLSWPQWQSRHFYSACGAEETMVSHSNDPVVQFNHSGVSTLDGFTVTGGSGRGIYSNGTNFDGTQSRPTIRNCIIRNNGGRGIDSYASNVTVTGCEIYENTGGGVQSYNTTISDTTIRNNSVTGNGGGIASHATGGSFTLSNVVIRDNTATGKGGGLYCDVSSGYAPAYERVVLSGNVSGDTGGAGYFTLCAPTFTNSLISDNSAVNGGGIGIGTASSVWFDNSTIANNTASGDGGGYHTSGQGNAISLANSIAWGNRAGGAGHIGRFAQTSGSVVNAYLYDSIIENNGDADITDDNYFSSTIYVHVIDTGTNNDSAPNFVNPDAGGDYHINTPSAAIDNAADHSGRGLPAIDLEGNSRPPGEEDIGAYEY